MGKRITEITFAKIKALIDAGLPTNTIAGIVEVAPITVTRARGKQTLAEYRSALRSQKREWMERTSPSHEDGPVEKEVETPEAPEPSHNDGIILDYLERITVSLERMADAWETRKDSRGGEGA